MRLSRPKPMGAAAVVILAGGLTIAVLWWTKPGDEASPTSAAVALPVAHFAERALPGPRATSPASLAATLRGNDAPPSPQLLRDNPQAQAAYDASAKPGDFVTPPSVSVEH